MIVVDPEKRISAADALNHEWILHKGGEHRDSEHRESVKIVLDESIIQNLRNYKG